MARNNNQARRATTRIEAALDNPASLDAQLVLLTIHAKVIQPSVVYRFELEPSND